LSYNIEVGNFTHFKKAKRVLKKQGVKGRIIGVNGCMYGKDIIKPLDKQVKKKMNFFKTFTDKR